MSLLKMLRTCFSIESSASVQGPGDVDVGMALRHQSEQTVSVPSAGRCGAGLRRRSAGRRRCVTAASEIHHRDVGSVLFDRVHQRRTVTARGHQVVAVVPQETNKTFPQRNRVVRYHDPQHGNSTVISVGPPAGLVTLNAPPVE